MYAVIENSNRRVTIIEPNNGCFLLGSGVDVNEPDIDAVKREILEEIGYQATVLNEISGAVKHIKTDGEG